jgi:ADP-dependent NAD(P)H-hydrate dehydratase / NAD(P)H-hydrate epimerase
VSLEIITVAQMRAIDQAAARAGIATRTLMENAGHATADAIAARFSPRPTAVLCGPGNNGGDGWVAARALKERGWPVWVETLVPREALGGDAAHAAAAWGGEAVQLGERPAEAELFVDALFGAGLSRPLEGESARLARALPAARVVAVDVPSGIAGDSGAPLGGISFSAALTVTFVRKKPAHVLAPGRARCGEVLVADIGAPEAALAAQAVQLWENTPLLWRGQYPWPDADTHKHRRGHVYVISGPATRTGAARLAARGALRIGAGLVSVAAPPEALAEHAAQLNAIMLRAVSAASDYARIAGLAQAMVIGPAFGIEDLQRAALDAVRTTSPRCPVVFDADALTLLGPLRAKLDPRDVLTPHVGEFKRLFPGLLEAAPSRIEAARAAAAQAGCTLLLKGVDTVIAAPDGRAIVNTTGTPFLATAGSGDVLAGFIAGLIGQGTETFEAAAAGAWLHGKAAEVFGPGLIAEDLPEILPLLLSGLEGEKAASSA